MASLRLEIVTPDKVVLNSEAEYVGAPGIEGEFGILPGHVPFLTALAMGVLHYQVGGKTKYAFISGGFAEVSDNKVTILADSAEEAESIDFARAEQARQRAERRITAHAEDMDRVRAQAALHRAIQRLSLQGRQ